MPKIRMFAGSATMLVLASAVAVASVPRMFQTHRATGVELSAAAAGAGSLDSAIAAVERSTGGRVVEIHFEGGNGAAYYDATVARDGAVNHAFFTLNTKQIAVVSESGRPVRSFDYSEKAGAELVVRTSNVNLGSAVRSAEEASHGVAIAARTTRSHDGYMVAHDVETLKGDMVRPVLVDAKTGLVIGDRQAFAALP